MKLISCDFCGVVLDADKLNFPEDMEDEDGCIDDNKARYNQRDKEYQIYVHCPVCEHEVWKC